MEQSMKPAEFAAPQKEDWGGDEAVQVKVALRLKILGFKANIIFRTGPLTEPPPLPPPPLWPLLPPPPPVTT